MIYADLTHRLCPRVEPSSVTLDWNEGREREARVQQDPVPTRRAFLRNEDSGGLRPLRAQREENYLNSFRLFI